MAKTIPISVRVSNEDAEFIANLEMDSAITPSDKVRAIIKNAKKQKERTENYDGYLKSARDILKTLMQEISSIELKDNQHSDIVNLFTDWVAESFAFAASSSQEIKEGNMSLVQFEEGISNRVFRLFESVARLGVTSNAPCYDKEIITKGFAPILELTQIINQRITKEN